LIIYYRVYEKNFLGSATPPFVASLRQQDCDTGTIVNSRALAIIGTMSTTYSAVLANLREQRDQIDAAIRALESLNGNRANKGRPTTKAGFVKRAMSASARRRIALAQEARWAAWRKRKAA